MRWRSFDTWPPKDGATPRSLYLRAGGKLSFDPPEAGESPFDQYVSDPAHPVPYRPRPIEQTYDPRGSRWRTWETIDQRFVDRPSRRGELGLGAADGRLLIAGDVTAQLIASTTGRDADWAVKLIDVFPDSVPEAWQLGGYQLMVAHEIMRGRYRKSFSKPEPLAPNTPLAFTVDLHQQSHTRSGRATASWCRCRAPGFPSTTGIRRPGCRTSSRRRRRTSRRRPTGSGTPRPGPRTLT